MGALAQRCAVGLPLDPEPQGGDDPVDVVQDGLCVEADEMYTAGSKDAVARSVEAHFDGERECRAVEVDNEASDVAFGHASPHKQQLCLLIWAFPHAPPSGTLPR